MPDPLIAADGYECATCGHEWIIDAPDDVVGEVRDSNGTLLADGDDVVIIKVPTEISAPVGTRTPNLLFRRQVLYPIELQAQIRECSHVVATPKLAFGRITPAT